MRPQTATETRPHACKKTAEASPNTFIPQRQKIYRNGI